MTSMNSRAAGGSTQPFRVRVEQRLLDDLSLRLANPRWTRVSEQDGWDSGTDPNYLRELITYWHTHYDWRLHEARINTLPQFQTRLDAVDLHFVHVDSRASRSMPLLLLHGWPDSFLRFHKVIPLLAGLDGAFDVVVPSLPGFAFSSPVDPQHPQPTRRSAELLWRLMTEVLGYERFAVAGGDGGSAIAQILAIDHPQSIIGVHLTDLGWHASRVDPSAVSKSERKYLDALKKQFMSDGAYAMVQSTRPRSLAVGLADSPIGLASWIIDRFHAWCDGDLDDRFGKDELLTNIMLYWTTQTIGSSIFSYYAEAKSPSLRPTDYVERPVALALFPHDIGGIPPRQFAARTLNVQRWTAMPRGGHFAALEEPDLYARDVIEFFRSLRVRAT